MLTYLRKSRNVLGINARNYSFLKPSNSKRANRIADSKLRAKRILAKNGLPVLLNYGVIKTVNQLKEFDWSSLPNSFTLKPDKGLGGAGILIVFGKKKKFPYPWVKADRKIIQIKDLEAHALNILEGTFSRTGLPDTVFFEERIKLIKLHKPYVYRGIPDIRVIVYNGVPIMGEMRLPTKESGGKANLHMGGIGVGIDMGTGVTTTAIVHDRTIEYVPGKKIPLRGIHIPFWKEILRLAVHAQLITKIGFLGIDIALDREKGPVILELNTRPGLSIQNANMAPLADRLKRVMGLKVKTISKGVELGQSLFGGEIEETLEGISGRKVIGINERIEIVAHDESRHPKMAKVDTGAYRTTICKDLADKLGINKVIKTKRVRGSLGSEERPIINLSFYMDKRLVGTEAFVADRDDMKYDVIVGRRDLKRFLVDPAKNVFMIRPRSAKKSDND